MEIYHGYSVQHMLRRFSFINVGSDEYCLKVRQQAASLAHPNTPLGGFMIALGMVGSAASGEEAPWVIG